MLQKILGPAVCINRTKRDQKYLKARFGYSRRDLNSAEASLNSFVMLRTKLLSVTWCYGYRTRCVKYMGQHTKCVVLAADADFYRYGLERWSEATPYKNKGENELPNSHKVEETFHFIKEHIIPNVPRSPAVPGAGRGGDDEASPPKIRFPGGHAMSPSIMEVTIMSIYLMC